MQVSLRGRITAHLAAPSAAFGTGLAMDLSGGLPLGPVGGTKLAELLLEREPALLTRLDLRQPLQPGLVYHRVGRSQSALGGCSSARSRVERAHAPLGPNPQRLSRA